MRNYIEQRVLETTTLFLENKTTVRGVAKLMGSSKSTVHKDLTLRLPQISYFLYKEVSDILKENKAEATMRGGLATRERFKGGL